MKFTIMGFSQEYSCSIGLDLTDLLLIRYIVDFKDSGKMTSKIIKDDKYYWVNYATLLKEIPIIGIKSKDVLRRRLRVLEQKLIIKHECVKSGGTFSYYSLSSNYQYLISSSHMPTNKANSDISNSNNNITKNNIQGSNPKNYNKPKQTKFNDMLSRNYNYEMLEQLEDDYIDKKISDMNQN